MLAQERTTRVLLRTAALAALSCLSSLALWAVLPLALGWHPSVVMTGSMMPSIQPGDVVIARGVPATQLRVHQVVLVPDPDHAGRLRLHRLLHLKADGRLVLRGDANPAADSSLVRADDVIGVGVLRIPFIGLPARAVSTRDWAQLAAMSLGLILTVALAFGRPPRDRHDQPPGPLLDQRNHRSPPRSRGPSRHPQLVARRLAVIALVVPLATLPGPGAYAAFKVSAANPLSQFGAAPSFYPYRDAVLADTPVLYWRLGEASGTSAANAATTGPAGTYYSTPVLGQASALTSEIVNKSISTATGGFVTAATATTAPAQFTVEAWIKTSTTAGGRIFGFGNSGTTTLSTTADRQLYLSPTGQAVAGLRNATLVKTVATSPLSYNDGRWHYLVATYNGTTLRLYVDGAQVASTTTTAAAAFLGYWRAATENLSGWPSAPSGTSYAGGLDELAVYASALTASRISAHWAAATT